MKGVTISNEFITRLQETGYSNELLKQFVAESGFLSAPAASTVAHHGCYDGGLVDHCMAVADASAAAGGDQLDVFLALVHDLCKAQLYIKLDSPEVRHGKECYYRSNPAVKGHGSLSVEILRNCGISLDGASEQAIVWHMGQWTHDAEDSLADEAENKAHFDSLCANNARLKKLSDADMYAAFVLGK